MKHLTTIKAALAAVRTGFATTAAATHSDDCEVVFTACFPKSGHVFYTCRMFGTQFSGFLNPEDEFSLALVGPKARESIYGAGWLQKNWVKCSSTEEHLIQHAQEVEHLLDKKSTFCPSRLRKFRA